MTIAEAIDRAEGYLFHAEETPDDGERSDYTRVANAIKAAICDVLLERMFSEPGTDWLEEEVDLSNV